MPLEPDDRAVLDRAEAAAARGQAAAEGVPGRLDGLTANVEALIRVVERLRDDLAETRTELRDAIVLAVTDVDHPKGATYLVRGLGADKTHIVDGEQWADLINGFPWLSPPASWAGRTLAKIPSNGPDPEPASTPAD